MVSIQEELVSKRISEFESKGYKQTTELRCYGFNKHFYFNPRPLNKFGEFEERSSSTPWEIPFPPNMSKQVNELNTEEPEPVIEYNTGPWVQKNNVNNTTERAREDLAKMFTTDVVNYVIINFKPEVPLTS